jgi:hypothetical protein
MCFLCDEKFKTTNENNKDYLAHILVAHKIVIADVKQIGDFKRHTPKSFMYTLALVFVNAYLFPHESYIKYWRERLQVGRLDDVCFRITTNSLPSNKGEKEDFFLLCDSLPEEKQLRESLKLIKLVGFCEFFLVHRYVLSNLRIPYIFINLHINIVLICKSSELDLEILLLYL